MFLYNNMAGCEVSLLFYVRVFSMKKFGLMKTFLYFCRRIDI